MSYKIAINGYGRIGRSILRALYESTQHRELNIIAINDLGGIAINTHLTKYDSVHGRFPGEVTTDGKDLIINSDHIKYIAECNPEKLPWKELGVDLVLECTGLLASRQKSQAHLRAGAKKVIISAPAGEDLPTIVYGVNHDILTSKDTIISNASCTTNCLAPMAKILHEKIGIESGLVVTVHAYTNDQRLTDSYHNDLRRARSATQSMIPTKTGAAAAVGLVLPALNGKLDGYAVRVPTINVSMIDLTFKASMHLSVEDINDMLKRASENELRGVLAYNKEPLVSIDFNDNVHSSIFDATQTCQVRDLVKVISWYDNEWGFSHRMLDTAKVFLKAK